MGLAELLSARVHFIGEDDLPMCPTRGAAKGPFGSLAGRGDSVETVLLTGHRVCDRCFDRLPTLVKQRIIAGLESM